MCLHMREFAHTHLCVVGVDLETNGDLLTS